MPMNDEELYAYDALSYAANLVGRSLRRNAVARDVAIAACRQGRPVEETAELLCAMVNQ